jgi:endonuclease G, mitochondrial
VSVPDSCFKIVVVLEEGQGLKDITSSTQVIAVCMPNIQGVRNDDWTIYQTSVDQIEASTGYDFLNDVPEKIQKVIESK